MNQDNKNADVNHQDHPHQEGQQNNIAPRQPGSGQRQSNNENQAMSSMNPKPSNPREEEGPQPLRSGLD